MKTLLVFAVSIISIGAFAGPKTTTRTPAQASRVNATVKSSAMLDANCLYDYDSIMRSRKTVAAKNMDKVQTAYLAKAVDIAKAMAKETQMAGNLSSPVVDAKIHVLEADGTAASVTVCDEKNTGDNAGQANCVEVYFSSQSLFAANMKKDANNVNPRVGFVIEDWHTGGASFYAVCQ